MKKLVRVSAITPLEDYKCRVQFEDGIQKIIDLEPYLRGPIFKPILDDIKVFRSMQIVEGTIGWENGADIDPDVLYYNLKPAWMEESVTP
jgi:hypothetical protein